MCVCWELTCHPRSSRTATRHFPMCWRRSKAQTRSGELLQECDTEMYSVASCLIIFPSVRTKLHCARSTVGSSGEINVSKKMPYKITTYMRHIKEPSYIGLRLELTVHYHVLHHGCCPWKAHQKISLQFQRLQNLQLAPEDMHSKYKIGHGLPCRPQRAATFQ